VERAEGVEIKGRAGKVAVYRMTGLTADG